MSGPAIEGRLLVGGRLEPGRLRIEGRGIAAVELDDAVPASAPIVAPGLVDLHVHGFGGCDPTGDLGEMARRLALAGTTTFQPTLFPAQPERLGAEAASTWAAAEALRGSRAPAADPVGLHLEGPFVNPERAGALPPEAIVAPSVDALRALLGSATGAGRGVRTVTLAPELPGAADVVAELVRSGVRVSLGHSSATASDARAAAKAGAVGATHLFNAMAPLHHREVGLAGFALTGAALYAEIIGDLAHVGRDAFELALKLRGPRGLCLVSDALPGAGTGCDVFHWQGREHAVRSGTAYFSPSGGGAEAADLALAGSAMGQLEMVRRLVDAGVVSFEEAWQMGSETPAKALGLPDRGRISPGMRADLVVLDQGLRVTRVLCAGRDVS